MEPRQPKPEPEPPAQVEGGEIDDAAQPPASEPTGMIGEGGRSGGGAAVESDRDGGMIGQG